MALNIPDSIAKAADFPMICEFDPGWNTKLRSTHELVITDKFIFVSGQLNNQIAKLDYAGNVLANFNIPRSYNAPGKENSDANPHGLMLDNKNQLWVSLESVGKIVRLDDEGKIVEEIDINMKLYDTGCAINPAPHGICLGADGETIWFTGKRTSTIGKVGPGVGVNRRVEHFELNTLAALPIFLQSGPDGNIWGTELLGNNIVTIAPDGGITETPIPTDNSRPIGIIPDPQNSCMWFTQEAGRKIGRIDTSKKDMKGRYSIAEFTLPDLQETHRLGSLCFDRELNLWVQVYTSCKAPDGEDFILKIDKSIRNLTEDNLSSAACSRHLIPSKKSMLHRIKMDATGNLWFTEMMTDKVGKISF